MQTNLLISIPIASLILSGIVGAFFKAGDRLRSALQHFAAGVVFAIVAVELLPDLRERHAPWEIAISFILGVLLMLVIRAVSERLERGDAAGFPFGMVAAVGVDLLFDGLLLGIGFAAGEKVGFLMALGLATETLSLGLALSSSLSEKLRSKTKLVGTIFILALTFLVGTLFGLRFVSSSNNHVMVWLLSSGSAALLYLVTEELLAEAHEARDTKFATTMFFAGFLLFMLLGMTI